MKFCLVGAGHMGGIHAQKLARMKGVTLARIVDANRSCAETTAQKCGVASWSESYDEALSAGMDAVVIASTTETHFAIARDFLTKGVHVFVEKPITATPDEATELIALARKKGLAAGRPSGEVQPPFQEGAQDGGEPPFPGSPPDKCFYR